MPSLREYVVLGRDRVQVEHDARQTGTTWLLRELPGADNLVRTAIGCEVPVVDLSLAVFGTGGDGD